MELKYNKYYIHLAAFLMFKKKLCIKGITMFFHNKMNRQHLHTSASLSLSLFFGLITLYQWQCPNFYYFKIKNCPYIYKNVHVVNSAFQNFQTLVLITAETFFFFFIKENTTTKKKVE